MKLFTLFIFSILIGKNVLGQSQTNYEIVQNKNGKYSLIDQQNRTVINKYQNCEVIDSIHNLNFPTNRRYKDYLTIQMGKTFILFNAVERKEIKKLEFDSKFSFSVEGIDFDISEKHFQRADPQTIRNYIKIHIKGEADVISLLYNFTSEKFISAMRTPIYLGGTSFELIKNDLILVSSDRTNNIIDGQGKIIVPSTTDAFFERFNGGCAFVNDDFKYGVVNYYGDTIAPFIYEKATASTKDDFVILENSEKRAGVINAQGKIIIPFVYRPQHPNFYRNYSYSNYGVFMLYKSNYEDSNFVFIDTNGVELIKESTYQNAWELNIPTASSYNERYYFVNKKDVGVFDTKQKKEIIPCEYIFFKEQDDTKFGVIGAKDKMGNWGLLSLETGATIIPFEYEPIKSEFIYTNDSIATYILCKQGKFGIINCKGNTQLPFNYSDITKSYFNNLVIIQKDGLYGLFDIRTSEFVIPVEMKIISKDLKMEKITDGRLMKGKFEVNNNTVKWEN